MPPLPEHPERVHHPPAEDEEEPDENQTTAFDAEAAEDTE